MGRVWIVAALLFLSACGGPESAHQTVFQVGDQAGTTSYEVRVWQADGTTLAGAKNIGKPAALDGAMAVDLEGFFAEVVAKHGTGRYTLSLSTIGPGGSTESLQSEPFDLPRPKP